MFIEDMHLELKREFTKDTLKTVAAFANTSGGKIYIGVDNFGEIIGVTDPDKELLQLTNSVRDGIRPDVTQFTSSTFETLENKQIIVFEVQKGTACPYYLSTKGLRPEGVYIRQGSSSVPASESQILKMIKETDGDSYEQLRSLNQDLTFETLKQEFAHAHIVLGKPQMRTLQIIGEDDLFTNLGLLLSDQCPHTTKAAVFEGTSKDQFKDRFEFSGSLIRQMREVYGFLDRYNRTQSVIKGLDRIDVREYPETAVREALLNSIVHKDYSFGSSSLVSVFDDRLEILTVGGLVKGLTRDDIMIGTSVLRNKNLANVFYRLKWIEAYGTGILRIIEAYEGLDVEPVFTITDNAFKITLPAIRISRTERKTGLELNDSEAKIHEMFKTQTTIQRKDIEQSIGISQAMAVKLIKGLLEKNVILKIGSGKNVRYRLAPGYPSGN